MSHWLAVTEKSMFYSPTVGWVDRHFGKRNDKYVTVQCVVFFSQCTKLEWGFVKSLVSFFFKIPPSYRLVSSSNNDSRTTGGKRILSLKFFTFIGVHTLWIDILIWFHVLYPRQLERWSEKERKVNPRACETHHKASQSNTFFFLLICPGGGMHSKTLSQCIFRL